ncbi:MAG: InlB B-repeat-containing protein [Clostridia bacterium]|nr:InlB B-repeat-containing protein [Clostridia bacterium]
MKKIFLSLVTLCLTAILLTSCDTSFITGLLHPDNEGGSTDDTTPKEYVTITFDTQGGSAVDAQTIEKGTVAKSIKNPVKSGYDFDGWYIGEEKWNSKKSVIENITVTAKYTLTEYTITYDFAGGNYYGPYAKSYTIESDAITLPNPHKQYCTFAGWYASGELVTEIPSGSTGNIELVADFYGPLATVTDSETSTARTYDNGNNVEVKLTSSEGEGPLKVRLTFGERPWHTVKVVQGKKIDYIQTYESDGKLMLDIEMTPNGDNAILTPVIMIGEEMIKNSNYGQILGNGVKIDTNYYPGFVRKAVTFTIDDGVVAEDKMFLDIVRPAGIIGTFNIYSTNRATAVEYLMQYKGYEIANHHQLHCLPWRDDFDFSTIEIKDEIFNSNTADVAYMYKSTTEGMYYIDYKHFNPATKSPYWHPIANDETYIKYIDITKNNIEKLFGEGSCVGFAYPHGVLSKNIKQYLQDAGYLYARRTGNLKDSTGFALPADRYAWTYNADVSCLLDVMAQYDALPDSGELKFFSFGVHSADFKGKWNVLQEFADKYGNRPDEFYYASNRDIFEYEDAVKALEIIETENGDVIEVEIKNDSDIAVFITVNGEKTIIHPHSSLKL